MLPSNTDEQADENFESAGRTQTATINQHNTKVIILHVFIQSPKINEKKESPIYLSKFPVSLTQMDFKAQPQKSWLRGKSLISLFRSRKENKKEEKRLQTAELHAALSLTQLAAAIAGISSSAGEIVCSPFQSGRQGASPEDMGNVLSSAAALVTSACAEAAESLGAHRAQVRAAVDSGMAIQSPIDMIAVTATAATCMRYLLPLNIHDSYPFSRMSYLNSTS